MLDLWTLQLCMSYEKKLPRRKIELFKDVSFKNFMKNIISNLQLGYKCDENHYQ